MKKICARSETKIREGFSCAFDNLDELRVELSSLGSDYACDPYYLKAVDRVNLAAEILRTALVYVNEVIGYPEEY